MKSIILFLISISLFAQSNIENFFFIKDLIDRSNLQEAQRQIELLKEKNPHDPTLELYQTEIWINTGEQNYKNSNFKTAFINFKKAYEVYPSNSLVRARYKELSEKILFDSNRDVKKNSFPIYPLGLQGMPEYEFSEKQNNKESIVNWTKTEIILGIICIQNFLLIASYLFRRN
jgi:hypothetical protein